MDELHWRGIEMMRERKLICLNPHGLHRIAYNEWIGAASDTTLAVICVSGYSRNAHSFDILAEELSQYFRVICPDIVGRGKSDWLKHPEDYSYRLYINDMVSLIARLGVEKIFWVGSSMGGIMGMILASFPDTPIQRLVVNDAGPFLQKEGLIRMASFLGADPSFKDLHELEIYLRKRSSTWGVLSLEQWHQITVNSARIKEDGSIGLAYDPCIDEIYKEKIKNNIDMWKYWNAIRCPTLILRGAESDVLSRNTAMEMINKNPHAKLVEFEKIGHFPALMSLDQIEVVRNFLIDSGR